LGSFAIFWSMFLAFFSLFCIDVHIFDVVSVENGT
jgi:hypothetical protein